MNGLNTASTPDTILLNCCPPGDLDMPSASLSILKAYLEQHHYPVKIIYWNILIFDVLRKYPEIKVDKIPGRDLSVLTVLPYLVKISKSNSEKCDLLLQRFRSFLSSEEKYSTFYITALLEEINQRISKFVTLKIRELTQGHSKFLFGISAKYYEWIWGQYLIGKLKSINKDAQTIVGGFSTRKAARSYITLNREIDYCMYGESEEPLVKLMNALRKDSGRLGEIPRFFYREENLIERGESAEKAPHEFRESLFPDYSDYFNTISQKPLPKHISVRLPLDGTRGCSWNRCRFCVATQGVKYHERSAVSLIKEMNHQSEKHNCFSFYTTDDDFNPEKSDRLKNMAEIIRKTGQENKFSLETWLTPSTINYDHLKQLAQVCKLKVKAGLESTSDRLLEKMGKKNRFIDNLFFLRNMERILPDFQITYSIITGIPDEHRDDVLEAIENLQYLRFFIPAKVSLCFNKFQLAEGSHYFKSMDEQEKEKYISDGYGIFAPGQYANRENRFHFFFNTRKLLPNDDLWVTFKKLNDQLIETPHEYKIDENERMYYEFSGKKQVKSISLTPLEIKILKCSGKNGFCSEEDFLNKYDRSEFLSCLSRLQHEKLVFCARDQFLSIVSV